jgi:hypothetical protein
MIRKMGRFGRKKCVVNKGGNKDWTGENGVGQGE